MPDFKVTDVTATPYLYVERSCSMDPADISAAMGAAFQRVGEFMQTEGIVPAGPALSVYNSYDPTTMIFRAGYTIAHGDMARAAGDVKADETPAGRALHFVHKGPYATLRDDYGLMMQHLHDHGLKMGTSSWEMYINDASDTAQADLLTDCFTALA